uniref:ELMO domain-containing protein n=1 Tax=Toxocara canis TaxID=6265 RepID=A0A183UVS8_TOXCA
LVNDINAGEEQLFASGKPVYMEFGLEFDFTVSSLSRMRFANTANQNAGLDEINLAMIERFHQATDSTFTVCALDGQMSLPHCLLPMLSLQFSEHFADGATTTSVSIPFTMNIFTQVFNALLFNQNDFEARSSQHLQKILQCLHFLNPDIGVSSSQEMPIIHSFVAQDWEERSLEELMEAMNEAIKCNLPNLVLIILNIIVDWHYAEFRRKYEADCHGERRQFLERIQKAEVVSFGEQMSRHIDLSRTLRRLKRARYNVRRIFRFKENIPLK